MPLSPNPELVARYNINGPRYTSYPTALELRAGYPQQAIEYALGASTEPLSLYLHVPFCSQLCYYCGCNKVVTRHQNKADTYLAALAKECQLYAPLLRNRPLANLHIGGGTPTFLSVEQLQKMMQILQDDLGFLAADANEISIEIDPRTCDKLKLQALRELGFNRVSYGVQDFNDDVQIAINRVQPLQLIENLVNMSKQLKFESINLDLVYGLPYQNTANFAYTLQQVIALDPDRVSLFSYAHLPKRFAAQRKIPSASLAQGSDKQALLLQGIEALTAVGYQFIGMDHFAKPRDSLAIAQRAGCMQRNFQGYTTHGDNALLGLGVSSISQINGVIWQHAKDLPDYYGQIQQQQLPVSKNFQLSQDDSMRAALIKQLICHFQLDIPLFEQLWEVNFSDYFAQSKEKLAPYIKDNLVELDSATLRITEQGKLWVRSICTCFDAYLSPDLTQYSQVV